MNHLIILPCHSVWTEGPTLGKDRSEWSLAPFQIEGNDQLCFIDHIAQSFKVLQSDPTALLVISGGQTKQESTVSESESYLRLARAIEPATAPFDRVVTEEYARDSMENVVFSICRYFEVVGAYPEKITVVGFEFKRERFTQSHLTALRFPSATVQYIGNAPDPTSSNVDIEAYFEDLNSSEFKFALKPFGSDWFGVRPPLSTKKSARNPHNRSHAYAQTNPRLASFFAALEREGASNEEIQAQFSQIWHR